jgi:RNA polymerase sigma-70 factor (ECF subfamily)
MSELMTPTATAADVLASKIAAVAAGDRAAFEHLYRATSSKLFGVCLRVIPDRDEAEDVLQEVYATVWRKAGQFDAARASAITWLAMIARNKAIDRLRSSPGPARMAPIEFAEELPDPGASPMKAAEASTDRERLEMCMDQLEERRRSLIRTAFFDGATYEELATRIGSPLGSVKSWIRRGLMQLRACLEQ